MPYKDLQKRKEHNRRLRLIIISKDKERILDFLSKKYLFLNKNEKENSERYFAFEIKLRLMQDKEINKIYFDKYFFMTKINLLKDIKPFHRFTDGEIKEIKFNYNDKPSKE